MPLRAEDRDASADPGADFYRFANGGWLDANPIPPGYGSWGAFNEVTVRNQEILHALLLTAAEEPASDLDRMLGDYYAAGMDVAAIEAAGLSPIQEYLDRIASIDTHQDVLALVPDLHRDGLAVLWGWGTEVDHDDSSVHLLWLVQGGLGLPDRDSYSDDSDSARELRTAYVRHIGAQLANAGRTDGDLAARGEAVLQFETRLAEHHLRREQRRDPDLTLNRHDRGQLTALGPDLGLSGYLDALGAGDAVTVNVESPGYLGALHGVIADTDVAVLRDYLAFHLVRSVADALPAAIDDESFDFYGRRIQGRTEQLERHKRIIEAQGADIGEALGRRFVEETFPPTAKERAVAMVDEVIAEMHQSLQTREWMSEQTRTAAVEKLDAFRVKIGYPDEWRDWSGLVITRESYAANRLAATRFEVARQLARIAEPVDPGEWEMAPHDVNAYYHPFRNEIVFPAGILQPPMFDADADDALNYGGIGMVIAHEITHGFDDQGRRFDAAGAFRDWWTADDQARFSELADRLAAQFDDYEVLDGLHVNGRLTLGENIADLGGLALTSRAHARVSDGSPAIDGFTPAQRLYLAYATLWRMHMSDELMRTRILTDPHAPARLRVVGPLSNATAFAEAYGFADDAPVMRPVEDRIEIW
ncbi:MAG: M13 family metallopeptidase [Actinomycetes bacterium]